MTLYSNNTNWFAFSINKSLTQYLIVGTFDLYPEYTIHECLYFSPTWSPLENAVNGLQKTMPLECM